MTPLVIPTNGGIGSRQCFWTLPSFLPPRRRGGSEYDLRKYGPAKRQARKKLVGHAMSRKPHRLSTPSAMASSVLVRRQLIYVIFWRSLRLLPRRRPPCAPTREQAEAMACLIFRCVTPPRARVGRF